MQNYKIVNIICNSCSVEKCELNCPRLQKRTHPKGLDELPFPSLFSSAHHVQTLPSDHKHPKLLSISLLPSKAKFCPQKTISCWKSILQSSIQTVPLSHFWHPKLLLSGPHLLKPKWIHSKAKIQVSKWYLNDFSWYGLVCWNFSDPKKQWNHHHRMRQKLSHGNYSSWHLKFTFCGR